MATVFITGGAVRIGKGLANRFAQQGWNVGITYHTSEAEAEATLSELQQVGVQAAAVQCNVADEDALTQALTALQKEIGSPDAVVSNAGIFPDTRSAAELSPQDLRSTIDINTIPLLTIGRWMQALPEDTSVRRLVSISSLGGFEIWKDRIDYNVSKSALITLVESLARSLAPYITVNSVAPGAITKGMESSPTDAAAASAARIPMGRYGTPDDLFDAVWFFATASPYITGQTLIVDGGYHLVR